MRCLVELGTSPDCLKSCAKTMCAQATETAAAPSPVDAEVDLSAEVEWAGSERMRSMTSVRQSFALDT